MIEPFPGKTMLGVLHGAHPLSIATSLAFEGLSGKHPDNPTEEDLTSQYRQVWINVKTLYRNIYNAAEIDEKITPEMHREFAETILAEKDYIIKMLSEYNTKAFFYHNNLNDLKRKYPRATIREDKTAKQIQFTSVYNSVAKLIFLRDKFPELKVFNGRIQPETQEQSLVLTHLPLDLFSFHNFTLPLHLLESHTGTVKKREQWYTKYNDGKELSMIPFREDLIQLFGDKESIVPYLKKTRTAIIEIANKYNWTQATTLDKINYSINQSKDDYLKSVWRDIQSARYN